MDERDFELLQVLEHTRNITHASDVLYVTQSSLSKRISALEKELNINLLVRSRQGIHFTPEGEIVLKYVRSITDQLNLMRSELSLAKGFIGGTLNAGVSINYAQYFLPATLTAFRLQYPNVNIKINTDSSRKLYASLLDNNIDLAIIRGDYPWKGPKLLLTRENICAISLERMDFNNLSDTQAPYIYHTSDIALEREVSQWLREHNYQPGPETISVDSITTCVEMVNRGLGWTIVPKICLSNFKGNVVPLYFANGEPFVRSTYLMYTDDVAELPQIKAFIDTIREAHH